MKQKHDFQNRDPSKISTDSLRQNIWLSLSTFILYSTTKDKLNISNLDKCKMGSECLLASTWHVGDGRAQRKNSDTSTLKQFV